MAARGQETKEMGHKPLRILASDAEDLKTFSALLQDALVPAISLAFSPEVQRFVFHAFRFKWEDFHEAVPCQDKGMRVFSTVVFENVLAVQKHNFAQNDSNLTELSLLSLELPSNNQVQLNFSDQKTVLIHCKTLGVYLGDHEHAWETSFIPSHE